MSRIAFVPLAASVLTIGLCAQEPPAEGTRGTPVEAPAKARAAEVTALEKAVAEVRRDEKRLLVVALRTEDESPLPETRALLKVDKELWRTVLYEYVVLPVKQEVAVAEAALRKLPIDWNGTDFPMLQIVDDAGRRVTERAWATFVTDGNLDTKALRTWLEEHKAPPVDARKRLALFQADAKLTGRKLLVHLGAPW